MAFVSWMQPRDEAAASHSLSTLSLVAGGITLIYMAGQLLSGPLGVGGPTPGVPVPTLTDVLLTVVAAALIMVGGWSMRRRSHAHRLTWAAWPVGATAVIIALDLLSHDASAAAQIFLMFPALYAASQLRRPGVVVIVISLVTAEWVITFGQLPFGTALEDAGYMSAAIITTAALLTAACERQVKLVELLERQAAIDPLTGLVTRRVLDDAASAAMSGSASGTGTALIVIDVDHFKAINDTYGHPGGDAVLVQLADVLVACSRSTDVVSRLGGDEIALLLPGCSADALAGRADVVLTKIRGHRFEVGDGRFVSVTISGGLAHAPTDAVDLRSLYAAADRALYRAKHLGRNQIHAASMDAHRDDDGAGMAGSDDVQRVDMAASHRLDDGRVG
jgi:diguanylate cyclase (GGDEF)-like protein